MCGFLAIHLSTKMNPNGHLLSLPGHEELVPASPSFLPSYRSASGLIFSPPSTFPEDNLSVKSVETTSTPQAAGWQERTGLHPAAVILL